jgi:anti-anti-sigma factor
VAFGGFSVEQRLAYDGTVLLKLSGEFDLATVEAFVDAFEQALSDCRDGIVVDISELDFIAVAGFRALATAQAVTVLSGRWFLVLVDPWKMQIADLIAGASEALNMGLAR